MVITSPGRHCTDRGISNAVCFCSVEVLKAASERCSTGEPGLHCCLKAIRVLQKQIYVQGVLESVILCLLLPADVYQAHQQWQVPEVLPPYEVLAQWVPGAGLWLHGMAFALMAWSFAPAVCLGVSCCRHSQQRFTAAEYCKRSDPLPGMKRVVGLRWDSVLVVQLVFKAWRQVSDTP